MQVTSYITSKSLFLCKIWQFTRKINHIICCRGIKIHKNVHLEFRPIGMNGKGLGKITQFVISYCSISLIKPFHSAASTLSWLIKTIHCSKVKWAWIQCYIYITTLIHCITVELCSILHRFNSIINNNGIKYTVCHGRILATRYTVWCKYSFFVITVGSTQRRRLLQKRERRHFYFLNFLPVPVCISGPAPEAPWGERRTQPDSVAIFSCSCTACFWQTIIIFFIYFFNQTPYEL